MPAWDCRIRDITTLLAQSREPARMHHAIDHLEHYRPDLAAHLHAAIRTGTACVYQPAEPVEWNS